MSDTGLYYPLKFDPILKERLWGGTKLGSLLGKSTDSPLTGESWELSGVSGDVSIVSNAPQPTEVASFCSLKERTRWSDRMMPPKEGLLAVGGHLESNSNKKPLTLAV